MDLSEEAYRERLATLINAAIELRALKQTHAARELNVTDVTVHNWRRNMTTPSLFGGRQLMLGLGIPADLLLDPPATEAEARRRLSRVFFPD